MKTRAILIVFVALLLVSRTTAQDLISDNTALVLDSTTVYSERPDKDQKVVGKIARGALVEVLAVSTITFYENADSGWKHYWVEIRTDEDLSGWVCGKNLAINQETEDYSYEEDHYEAEYLAIDGADWRDNVIWYGERVQEEARGDFPESYKIGYLIYSSRSGISEVLSEYSTSFSYGYSYLYYRVMQDVCGSDNRELIIMESEMEPEAAFSFQYLRVFTWTKNGFKEVFNNEITVLVGPTEAAPIDSKIVRIKKDTIFLDFYDYGWFEENFPATKIFEDASVYRTLETYVWNKKKEEYERVDVKHDYIWGYPTSEISLTDYIWKEEKTSFIVRPGDKLKILNLWEHGALVTTPKGETGYIKLDKMYYNEWYFNQTIHSDAKLDCFVIEE
ncbi:MAG: SH3 domain-containing protein [Bacteroidetes bacterium]|nr:SH3 domain-containing protein [Bacteroidota bacterium]MBU1719262.1 SH3 domain-containing protein [Bacteroidota bacterium]